MDQPLFGDQTPQSKVAMIVFSVIMGAILAFTVIVCLVFGFQYYKQNVLFAILLLLLGALLFILFRWYQANDLDPKFKFYIAGFAIVVVWAAVVANTYAWMPAPPSTTCNGGNGLYIWQTKTCITLSNNIAQCQGYGMCLCFSQFPSLNSEPSVGQAYCGNCTACQGTAPAPALPPKAPIPPAPKAAANSYYIDNKKDDY
eukprot:TRINITY_DN3097_c1_g1_i1.p2 TRINITY_DN3097_c1_g1~~TRINITY_DN3097_c1_g1_i1.p2  ORF type:complete len:200 (-),score=45.92 TRINITY_DN3097_c1_g1_i1:94-693(-)